MTLMAGTGRDPLGRFYTHAGVGETLIRALDAEPPARVIDLGAGGGALTSAAGRRWPRASFVTVDLDGGAQPRDLFSPAGQVDVIADALSPDLVRLVDGPFDLCLTNPPYGMVPWRDAFQGILTGAGLACPPSGTPVSAESLFLAQAVGLVRPGGRIGLVAPDIMITGRRARDLRRSLVDSHRIEAVIQLPRGSFGGTTAQAFLVVIERSGRGGGPVPLSRVAASGAPGEPILVPVDDAVARMDHGFHACGGLADGTTSLRILGARLARGNLETTGFRDAGPAVFHTSDFPKGADRLAHRLPSGTVREGLVVGEAGDILVARVDRRLQTKVCLVTSGRAALSSSVIRIRVAPELSGNVARALLSARGEAALDALARGTGARMIAQADLMDMPISLGATPD